MTDEDYLTAVLNCDDQSGMATDAAWRAVSALRARAERAEAEVQRLHRVIAESLPYIDFAEQFAQAEATIQRVRALHGRHDPNCPYGEDCAGAGLCLACREEYPCATIRALNGDSDE